MKIETLKSRKRKYFLYVLIVGVVLLLILNLTTSKAKYKMNESIPLAKGTITYELGDLNIIAMFNKNDSGIYEEISTMPTSGYHINSNETYCKVNGEVDKEIEVEVVNNKVYVSNVKEKTKCYLYFDKDTCGSACKKILADNPIKAVRTTFDRPLTTNTTGTLFQASDNDGISYYYAGVVDNNWVKFGGFYWRIIRINGDGSIRMIYSGSEESGPVTTGEATQIGKSAFNENYNDNAYLGYMYTLGEVHGIVTDSTIKGVLDTWYNSNLASYSSYIATGSGAIFCNDRTPTSGSGTGTTYAEYAAYNRLYTNKIPSFKCMDSGDKFSVSIGLITADEVSYAGGVFKTTNQSYYLYTGQTFWTMTPYYFNSIDGRAGVFLVFSTGDLSIYRVGYIDDVRPVINLKSDTSFVGGGTGTAENPYVVE